jgi:hypothetical protein
VINQFNIEYPLWLIVIPLAVGLLFSSLLYVKNKNNKIGANWTIFLFVIRFFSSALIVLLLLSPFIKTTKKHIQKPKLLFAIDNSQSMIYSSDSNFLINKFPNELKEFKENFSDDYEVEILSFGQNVKPFDSLDFNEKISDYSKLFSYIEKHYQNNTTDALVLIGDGIFNRGSDPFYAFSNINIPVYSVIIGDTFAKPDLLINDISFNSLAYLNENVPLEINFSAKGLEKQNVTINIFVGGKLKKSRKVSVLNSDFSKTERFNLEAKKSGKLRIDVDLISSFKENNTSNNKKTVFVDVLDSKQKILILANSPHPDISAIKQAIKGFKNYEVDIVFHDYNGVNLQDYNLAILHQLPSISNSIALQLLEINKYGIPVLSIIGGQSKFNAVSYFSGSTKFNSVVNSFENSRASVNQNFPLFRLDGIDISLLEGLPPLKVPLGNFQNVNTQGVLAWQKINDITTNFPLFYFGEKDGIKNCIIMGEGLWLWRSYNFLEKSNFLSFDNIIGKTIQYLTMKADKRFFRVKSLGEYDIDNKIELQAELYNKSYQLIENAEVDLKLINEKGEVLDYMFSPDSQHYSLQLNIENAGVYKFEAKSNYRGQNYSQKGEFVVVEKNIESKLLHANLDLMFKLSEKNNGKLFPLRNMNDIIDDLKEKQIQNTITYSQTYTALNNIPWVIALILFLLSLEWILRKYLGNY